MLSIAVTEKFYADFNKGWTDVKKQSSIRLSDHLSSKYRAYRVEFGELKILERKMSYVTARYYTCIRLEGPSIITVIFIMMMMMLVSIGSDYVFELLPLTGLFSSPR
jgi:hypothetical protein